MSACASALVSKPTSRSRSRNGEVDPRAVALSQANDILSYRSGTTDMQGGSMKLSTGRLLAVALILALAGISSTALTQDKETVIKNREALMKGQSKDLGSVKAYIDGKGDQAQAETGAANLTQSMKKIPDAFPPGSDATSTDGKFATKPVIWSDWNKFLETQKIAAGKAEVLLVAIKSGDKATIQTAFGDLGKNGCGACHETFREKLKD
jgi:cytochrome c556